MECIQINAINPQSKESFLVFQFPKISKLYK